MSGYKDKMEGAADKAKGKAKDAYGGLTNDKSKQTEGKFKS
ncbi:CsbD family protein [Virgibacillus kimchii]